MGIKTSERKGFAGKRKSTYDIQFQNIPWKNTSLFFFGKERVLKISNNENLTLEEKELYPKMYSIYTTMEKEAFERGMHEALGWMEFVELE